MNPKPTLVSSRKWLLLILLTAAALRLYDVTDTPPGLTHDEADHGITAWQVVNGMKAIYFTVGYGREPLYDYSTAGLMTVTGPSYLAGRLATIFFSLLLIAGMYAWTSRAFDRSIALLTVAGIAVGFWALMTSRQSLRSETLPALFVLALFFFWEGLESCQLPVSRGKLEPFLLAGGFLGLTFYTYVPARILWAIFPTLLGYLALVDRALFRRVFSRSLLMLATAAVIGSPLFIYLFTHPGAEDRLRQLSGPLTAAFRGDAAPLLQNTLASLRLFTSSGDTFWRYNIPGKPFLQPVMGALFYLGLATSLWRVVRVRHHRWQSAAHFLALIWLSAGLVPVLITGPQLSMTQAISLQPPLYLFPAIGLATLAGTATVVYRRFSPGRVSMAIQRLGTIVPLAFFAVTAVLTARDYFVTWANAPEVRVQYETTMVEAMRYLNEKGSGAAAVSTISPNRYHSPAVAEMTLRNEAISIRWFDGRHSLLLPSADQSEVLIPGFTPLAPPLLDYFESAKRIDTLPLRPTDQDRPIDIFRLDGPTITAEWMRAFDSESIGPTSSVSFGDAIEFLGYDLLTPRVSPGGLAQIASLWRLKRPLAGAILFTHIQGPGGKPIAQADRLDAPGDYWYAGDLLIQLHQLEIPMGTAPGQYPIVVGVCQRAKAECSRLPILNGQHDDQLHHLTTITVTR